MCNTGHLIYLYIYRHRENGKAYVGITSNPKQRFRRHSAATSNSLAFNLAVIKYGIDKFDHKILAVFDDARAAEYHENAAIVKFGTLSPLGYNLIGGAPASQYCGSKSQETKDKISIANRGRKLSESQLIKLRYVMSLPETRNKMSKAMKGKVPSEKTRLALIKVLKGKHLSFEHKEKIRKALNKPEVLAKISETSRGRIPSPESRKKNSESHKGKIRSQEWCDNLSRALTGKTLPPEVREKIGKAHKGIPLSPEHREKSIKVLRDYWAMKKGEK